MKIVRYVTDKKIRYGILEGETVRELTGTPYRGVKPNDTRRKLSEVRLLAPCLPSKIVALGVNYRSHAAEVKIAVPTEPLIFLKPSTAVIGPEDNIIYPESSKQVDYEGELGVVIKKRACRVARSEAIDYILGFTCFNDVTARDLQSKDKQWTRAKGFDTFAAIGPCIETELDPDNVEMETRLNGELKQQASTRELNFPIAELVSFISHVMTLLPGDVIATGTPSGIGPMQPGDTVEVIIKPIGILRNHVARLDRCH
ncbi:MAG: fumarylacetoacetate hydrolase family protein [Dehalococcoidales bacterium]|nr:fumarylacetoacetate hydrolase family protein [Dehalococcoidales bacterium]